MIVLNKRNDAGILQLTMKWFKNKWGILSNLLFFFVSESFWIGRYILWLVLHIFLIANIIFIRTDKGKNSLRFWIDFNSWWRNNLGIRNKRNSIRRRSLIEMEQTRFI